MRLVQYTSALHSGIGALCDGGSTVVRLQAAAAAYLHTQGDPSAAAAAAIRIPADVTSFIRGGQPSYVLAQQSLQYALDQRRSNSSDLFLECSQIHLQAPLVPSLIACGGGNFKGHLKESGRDIPEHVEFFLKNPTGVLGPQDDVPYQPRVSRKLDYEAELGIIIGRRARGVSRECALEYVFGYTAVNDLAIRDRQLIQWEGSCFHVKFGDGKIFDSNFVLGPQIVTRDELPDPLNLSIRCWVNEELRQDGNMNQCIWSVAQIIEYYSQMMTLEPGFLICPGTPGGCAVGSDPMCSGRTTSVPAGSQYLVPGQTVVVEVEGIGRLENRVIAARVES